MIKYDCTLHMIGCCRCESEYDLYEENYISFLSKESNKYKYIVTIDDCCEYAKNKILELSEFYKKEHNKNIEVNILTGNCGIIGGILRVLERIDTKYYLYMHNDCLVKKYFVNKMIEKMTEGIVYVGGANYKGTGFDSWCVLHDTEKLKNSTMKLSIEYVSRIMSDLYSEITTYEYGTYKKMQYAIGKTYGDKCFGIIQELNQFVMHQYSKRSVLKRG